MRYIENMGELRNKAGHSAPAKEMVREMEGRVELWMGTFQDCPEKASGWGHHYFCEEDGGKLIFDLNKPYSHICCICGREYTGGAYDAAWIYMYRYEAIMAAFKAAALYKAGGGSRYLDFVKKVLLFYSENYSRFEIHGRGPTTSGNGKIMPQALNEAIFIVRAANILELVKEDIGDDAFACIAEQLLKPAAYFIEEQKKSIHNIPCWINAGVAAAGLLTGDEDLIGRAFDSEFGFENQVAKGVTQDCFWYEGSIHYNFFTIEALLNTLLFAGIYGKKVSEESSRVVKNMLIAPVKYAFDNLVLPNPNDGWPNLSLKTYSFLYEMGRKIFEDETFEALLSEIYRSCVPRYSVPLSAPFYHGDYSLEWLLFGKATYSEGTLDFMGKSYDFSTSNFAILKKENINTFIKYGHRSPSHAHPDKMNLEIMAFGEVITRDLSNCGYAARLCNEFHRTTAAHNTVVVDGKSHPSTLEGRTLEFRECKPFIRVGSENVYGGVDFTRELEQNPEGLTDRFFADSSELHTYDWIFHVEGELETGIAGESSGLGFCENGYQHFKNAKKLPSSDKLRLVWKFGHGVAGVQELDTKDAEVFLCKSYDNPVNSYRNTVILRKKGKKAEFQQRWCFSKVDTDHNSNKI